MVARMDFSRTGLPGKIGHVTFETICHLYGNRLDAPLPKGGCYVDMRIHKYVTFYIRKRQLNFKRVYGPC